MSHVAHIQTSFAPRANRRCNMCVWERDHRGFVGHKNESRRAYTHVTRAYAPWRAVQQCCVCVCVCVRERERRMHVAQMNWITLHSTEMKHTWMSHAQNTAFMSLKWGHSAWMDVYIFHMNACVSSTWMDLYILHMNGCAHTHHNTRVRTQDSCRWHYTRMDVHAHPSREFSLSYCVWYYTRARTQDSCRLNEWVKQHGHVGHMKKSRWIYIHVVRACASCNDSPVLYRLCVRENARVMFDIYTRCSCLCILQRFISFLLCVWERTLESRSTYTHGVRACASYSDLSVSWCVCMRERKSHAAQVEYRVAKMHRMS